MHLGFGNEQLLNLASLGWVLAVCCIYWSQFKCTQYKSYLLTWIFQFDIDVIINISLIRHPYRLLHRLINQCCLILLIWHCIKLCVSKVTATVSCRDAASGRVTRGDDERDFSKAVSRIDKPVETGQFLCRRCKKEKLLIDKVDKAVNSVDSSSRPRCVFGTHR